MFKGQTEQEWVFDYIQNGKRLPVVLGTRGTWSFNGKKGIILVAFTFVDIEVMREIHKVMNNPIRRMKYNDIVYYAVNIVEKKKVKEIIEYWREDAST